MNDQGRTLITRFVILFPLLSLAGIGLYRLFLPLLAPGSTEIARHVLEAIIPACTIGLATSAALSFSALAHGAREKKGDLTPIRVAIGWIIFFALALTTFSTLGLPALHQSLAIEKNMPTRPRPDQAEPPVNIFKEGIKLYYDGKYEAAIEKFLEFLKHAPKNSIALDFMTGARSALAQEQSIKNTRLGDQTRSFRRGYDNLLEGNYLLAIMEFERILRANPKHTLAKQHLEDARTRLKAQQAGSASDIRSAGLKARLERAVARGLDLCSAKDWKGCLRLMSEVLLLDPSHPTALRNANLAREQITSHEFLDEELLYLPWYPALSHAVLRTQNGGILTASRLSRSGNQIWLQDFWLLPPPGSLGRRFFARYGKTISTNSLVWHSGLEVRDLTNGRFISTPLAGGVMPLALDPSLSEAATLVYGERLTLSLPALVEHASTLAKQGYPPIILWRMLSHQISLPFLVFLLAGVAAATGWRFAEQPSTRSHLLIKFLAAPAIAAISWFCYGTLVRINDSMVFAADALGLHGWAAIPLVIVFYLVASFFFLARLLKD